MYQPTAQDRPQHARRAHRRPRTTVPATGCRGTRARRQIRRRALVVRQALAALARDGLIVSAYPRGYACSDPASRGSALAAARRRALGLGGHRRRPDARQRARRRQLRIDLDDPVIVRPSSCAARAPRAVGARTRHLPAPRLQRGSPPALARLRFRRRRGIARRRLRPRWLSRTRPRPSAHPRGTRPPRTPRHRPVLTLIRIAHTTTTPSHASTSLHAPTASKSTTSSNPDRCVGTVLRLWKLSWIVSEGSRCSPSGQRRSTKSDVHCSPTVPDPSAEARWRRWSPAARRTGAQVAAQIGRRVTAEVAATAVLCR